MKIKRILSCRFHELWPSYDLIFEWENILAQHLCVPIQDIRLSGISRFIYRLLHHRHIRKFRAFMQAALSSIKLVNFRYRYSLVFDLTVRVDSLHPVGQEILPVIIDFWKNTDLAEFYAAYRACKLVFVSSLEVYNYLRQHNCPLPLVHLPLSLPDYYRLSLTTLYTKKYDILLAGRVNDVLLNYVVTYTAKHPQVEFLRQVSCDGELHYVSNTRGLIGKFHTRTEYINLLRASKIAFYSTPGIDGGEYRTGGFNPVTPRFLELLSAQCLLLGRYPDNEETRFYEVDKVCPNITSYEQFEQTIQAYLQVAAPPLAAYQAILAQHYTSRRARELQDLLARY